MSRIGNKAIPLTSGISVTEASGAVTVKGPKGSLTKALPAFVNLQVEKDAVRVTRADDSRQARANHGLTRALLNTMVKGVTQGFEKRLEIVGVGYRAETKGKNLVLLLGYSHPVEFAIPKGIDVKVEEQTKILVTGVDKQQVGQVAAELRSFRKPDVYKGKGVRYTGEYIRIKAGKSA